MNKVLRIILLMVAMAVMQVATAAAEELSNKEGEQRGAVMVFGKTSHNFGEFIRGGESKTHTFEFTNEGDVPLVVVRSKSSCKCVVVSIPKRPVMPGQKGQIVVEYVPKDKGVFNKGIEIFANTAGGSITLFVKGEVK